MSPCQLLRCSSFWTLFPSSDADYYIIKLQWQRSHRCSRLPFPVYLRDSEEGLQHTSEWGGKLSCIVTQNTARSLRVLVCDCDFKYSRMTPFLSASGVNLSKGPTWRCLLSAALLLDGPPLRYPPCCCSSLELGLSQVNYLSQPKTPWKCLNGVTATATEAEVALCSSPCRLWMQEEQQTLQLRHREHRQKLQAFVTLQP